MKSCIKKIILSFCLITIVATPLFVFLPHKTSAAGNLDTVTKSINTDPNFPPGPSVATFLVNIGNIQYPPTDKNNNGRLDSDEYGNTTWDILLDSDMEKSSKNGVFLEIATGRDETKDVQDPDYLTGKIGFSIKDPEDATQPTGYYKHSYGGTNIGYYIFVKKATQNFFGKSELTIQVPVQGLDATAPIYYYRVLLARDGTLEYTYSLPKAFNPPSDSEVTTNETGSGGVVGSTEGGSTNLPICFDRATGDIFPTIYMAGCISQIVYYAFFVPTSFLFSLSGQLLDWAMGFTLDSNSYKGSSAAFVEQGWKITRDIANILFIFILLWTGISTILGSHSVNAKKTIGMTIIIALLLNFSLFFARVIIDASNILGGVFYNNIGTNDTSNVQNPWISENTKNISVAIVSTFNPQKVFEQASTLKLTSQSGVPEAVGVNGTPPPLQFGIISLIMSIINCVGIWVFVSVAFLFLARVAGLWILMIFAPVAFISYLMPGSSGGMLGEMHHTKWWGTLAKQAFVVPIFMFFMYLILTFMNTNFFKDLGSDKTTSQIILGVIIPLAIIAVLLTKARSIAVEWSGKVGEIASKGAVLAGGLAVGLASGGVALVGRNTVGKYAMSVANDEKLKARAVAGDKGAQRRLDRANALAKNSFDFRQTKALKLAGSSTGMDFNKGLSFVNLESDKFKGGRKAQFDHEVEHEQKRLASYQMSGATAQAQDKKVANYKKELEEAKEFAKKKNKEWEERYEADKAIAAAAITKGFAFDEEKFRKDYEEGRAVSVGGRTVTPPPLPPSIGTDKEAEKAFEKQFKKDYTTNKVDITKKYGVQETYKVLENGRVVEKKRDRIGADTDLRTSKDINGERKEAYALSLEKEHYHGVEAILRNGFKGLKSALPFNKDSTARGVLATAAAGLAFGSLGIAGVLAGAGVLHAIKEAVLPGVHASDAEVIAAIRKGEDKEKKLLKDIAKIAKGDDDHGHGGGDKAHAPAAHAPAPAAAAHAPAGDAAHAEHH